MNKFLKLDFRKKIIIIIAIHDKFTATKYTFCIKFHQELSFHKFYIVGLGISYFRTVSLGVLFEKWLDVVLQFLGLAYIFHELVCNSKFKNVIHITWI